MFSTSYALNPEYQAHVARAHRMRAEATGQLFRGLFRRIGDFFQTGWMSAAAR